MTAEERCLACQDRHEPPAPRRHTCIFEPRPMTMPRLESWTEDFGGVFVIRYLGQEIRVKHLTLIEQRGTLRRIGQEWEAMRRMAAQREALQDVL